MEKSLEKNIFSYYNNELSDIGIHGFEQLDIGRGFSEVVGIKVGSGV